MGGSRLGQWLRRHEVAAWLGVALGLVSIAISPMFGWVTPVGIALTICGGVLVGILLTAYLMAPSRHQLKCISCECVHALHGARGVKSTRKELTRFKANADLPSFVYAAKKTAGTIESELLRFRNLGSGGHRSEGWFDLGKNHIFAASSPDDRLIYTIQPPTPIRKGDIFEVSDELATLGAFNNDDEYVGKNLIYPTGHLRLMVEFDGCGVKNCLGTRFELRVIDGEQLRATTEGSKSFVVWELTECKPGQSYRIEWKWAG